MRIVEKSFTCLALAVTLIGSTYTFAATAPPLSNPNATPEAPLGPEYYGSLMGSASVSAAGNATYSLPIPLPPGTNGMTPSLSLGYNSNLRNGLLGLGWFMSGPTSKVTRCAQTIAQDGQSHPVNYTFEDRFCLDGRRLVVVNGGAYGDHGTEYRTEVDSFERVTSYGTVAGGSGPEHFLVESSDGRKHYYGNTTDSRIEAQGIDTVHTWAVSESVDVSGNYITYTHYEHNSQGSYRPGRIEYGGNHNEGTLHYVQIDLIYESRPDVGFMYRGGSKLREYDKRLSSIEIDVDNYLVTKYNLEYEEFGLNATQIPTGNQSRLIEIERCDKASKCQEPLTFEWVTDQSGLDFDYVDITVPADTNYEYQRNIDPRWHDLNGDGVADYVRTVQSGSAAYNQKITGTYEVLLSGPNGYTNDTWYSSIPLHGHVNNITWGDMDGDGRTDMVTEWPTTSSQTDFKVSLSTGTSFSTQTWTGYPDMLDETEHYFYDMNGDRLLDLVVVATDKNTISTYLCDGSTYANRTQRFHDIHVGLNNGTGFDALQLWASHIDYTAEFADMNGDGLADLIETTKFVHPNTGSGFAPRINYGSFGTTDCNQPYEFSAYWADMNHDGLTDRLTIGTAGLDVEYNTGKAFVAAGIAAMLPVADMNGNAKTDGFFRFTNYTNYTLPSADPWSASVIALAKRDDYGGVTMGDGFADAQKLYGFQQLVDIDGDGITDYVANPKWYCVQANSSQAHNRRWCETDTMRVYSEANTHHHLMKKVVGGLGYEVEFAYDPLTNSDTYTKGTSSILPIEDVQDGTHVVSSITRPDGIGGTKSTTYKYEGLRRDLSGRGLLGFSKITSINLVHDSKTETEYAQVFPYSSSATRVDVRRNSDDLLIKRTDTSFGVYGTLGNGPVFAYVDNRTVTNYDIDDGGLLSTNTIDNVVDAYGNITERTVVATSPHTSTTHLTKTITGYSSLTGPLWRPSQKDSVVIEYSLNGVHDASKDRQMDYTYYIGNGLLHTSIREQGAGAGLEMTRILEYDNYGNVKKETLSGPDFISRISEVQYDARGRFPLQFINPKQHDINLSWDEDYAAVKTQTDANNQTTTFEYDTFGRRWKTIRPDLVAITTKTFYDTFSAGHPASATYTETQVPATAPVRRFMDFMGRNVRVRSQGFDGSYLHVDTDYDVRGRVLRKSDPYFVGGGVFWSTSYYDHLDRAVWLVASDSAESFVRLFDDNKVTTYNSKAHASLQAFSAVGQLVLAQDNAGTQTQFFYDAAGNRREVVNDFGGPLQNSVTYTHDRLGRQLTQSDPNHGLYVSTYDGMGQVRSQVSPRMAAAVPAQNVTFDYDLLGRVISRTEPEGTTVWTYDNVSNGNLGVGRLHDEVMLGFIRTHSYSPAYFGLLTGTETVIDGQAYTSGVTYDSNSRPAQTTYPSGFIVEHKYNALGFLERQQSPGATEVYYQLVAADAYGRRTQEWLGDGSNTSIGYHGQSARIASQHAVNGGTDVQHFSYSYDAIGSLETRDDLLHSLSETFTYDGIDRLKSAQVIGSALIDYSFDQVDNLTKKQDAGDPFLYTSSKPHAVNQIIDGGATKHLLYDPNGNLQSGDDQPTIVWSSYNKPTSLTKGSVSYQFYYGPDRARYKKVHGGVTTHYLGSGSEKKITSSGNVQKDYIVAYGQTIAQRKVDSLSGVPTLEYIHRDRQNSVTAITSGSSGAVIERYSFDAWGKRRSAIDWISPVTSALETRGYTGHEHLDDVGAIHMNGRVYNPSIGRMLSPDPFVPVPSSGRSYNRYTYARNNPLKYIDPTGFIEEVVVTATDLSGYAPSLYGSSDGGSSYQGSIAFIPGCCDFQQMVENINLPQILIERGICESHAAQAPKICGPEEEDDLPEPDVGDQTDTQGEPIDVPDTNSGDNLDPTTDTTTDTPTDTTPNEIEEVLVTAPKITPEQCTAQCLNFYYGDSYDLALSLSPLALASAALNVATLVTTERLEESIPRNLHSENPKLRKLGNLQKGAQSVLGKGSAAGAVLGFGAMTFHLTAEAYCSLEC